MANNTLVFATHNNHKREEAQALLFESSFSISNLSDYPETAAIKDIPETGETFQANAQQKVDFVKKLLPNLSIVGDDSGLEVRALNGKPGIHSKRWIEGTDTDRNNYLLQQLQHTTDRTARFITVLCLFDQQTQKYHFFEGIINGTIALETRGTQGFGYDPLFIPEGYDKTFAELGEDVKNMLSHRARAFKELITYLAAKE